MKPSSVKTAFRWIRCLSMSGSVCALVRLVCLPVSWCDCFLVGLRLLCLCKGRRREAYLAEREVGEVLPKIDFISKWCLLPPIQLSPCAVSSWISTDHHGKPSCYLSVVASLSSANFIPVNPVTSCISSIHLLFGRPLLLLTSLHASIIPFFNPSDLITCSKSSSFLLIAYYCIKITNCASTHHGHSISAKCTQRHNIQFIIHMGVAGIFSGGNAFGR